nr:reverse transcriptase domain-containing protein [Tanacetum cinerariifolium]GEZ68339.1 reverse transcriptase domain-containing protein [Tanacetum cinerariifolium]
MVQPPSPDYAVDIPEVEPVQPEIALAAPELAPPSLDHVFKFPGENLEEEEKEEEPKEKEPEEVPDVEDDIKLDPDDETDEPDAIFLFEMEGSPKPPPPVPYTLFDTESETATVGPITQVPFIESRFLDNIHERGGSSSEAPIIYHPEDLLPATMKQEIILVHHKFINGIDRDLIDEIQHGNIVEHRVTALEDQVQDLLINKRVAKALADDKSVRENVEGPTGGARGPARRAGGPAGDAGGPAAAPAIREYTFASFMKCNPITFHITEGAVELCRWFEKMEMVFSISECAEGKKGDVTSSRPANLNEAVHMAYSLMDQRLQARAERIIEGHTRNRCPKKNNQQTENAQGRAYVMKEEDQNLGPNVVTGTFLLNNRSATVLFDSGFDKCFVSTNFSTLIDINPVRLDKSYEVELVDEKIVSTNTVLKGCTLNLANNLFEIDLIPIELGTFDAIIRIDWLSERDVVIVCGKKIVCIPYDNKTFEVEGDEEKCLEDVHVILNFPKVFPEDLLGLPPP